MLATTSVRRRPVVRILPAAWCLVALAFGSACSIQDELGGPSACRDAIAHTDPFGRDTRGRFYPFDNEFRGIGLKESDDAYFLTFLWHFGGIVSAELPSDADIHIALADKTTFVLRPTKGVSNVGGHRRNYVFTEWPNEARIMSHQLQKLADSELVAAKTEVAGIELWLTVPSHIRYRMRNVAICLLRGPAPEP